MKRFAAVLSACLLAVGGLTACQGPASPAKTDGKLAVFVTINALQEFSQAVGGDKVTVTALVPDGMEAHDFEPKAQDLAALSKGDVLVCNGLGMDDWATEAAHNVGQKDLVVVTASDGADLLAASDVEGGDGDSDSALDPHLWLGLTSAQREVTNIRDGFIAADPGNRAYYEANCAAYVAQLQALLDEYQPRFAAAPRKDFVTGHAAFGYLCRDMNLTQRSVQGVYAEGEPSARQVSDLVAFCRENDVTTIFAEEMASPEVSRVLADEVGAKVETIYTMENAEDGKSYLERMENNLQEILASLTD